MEYYSSHRSNNTYNDYDYYDELYSSKYVDNIDPFLKGTIFEKEPEELSLFSLILEKYFQKVLYNLIVIVIYIICMHP